MAEMEEKEKEKKTKKNIRAGTWLVYRLDR